VAFEAVSEYNRSGDAALGVAVKEALAILGFSFEQAQVSDELTPRLVEILIDLRNQARERRDFKTGDAIRDRLKEVGIVLEDSPTGTKWKLDQ
jgi:cysteinyl-tRNA synthetase